MKARLAPVLLAAVSLLSVGTGCSHQVDRSHEAGSHFGTVADKCFVVQDDLFVLKYKDDLVHESPYALVPPGSGERRSDMPPSVDDYEAGKESWRRMSKRAALIDGVLPRGTHIKIDGLLADKDNPDAAMPFAKILDGPYKGKSAAVTDLLTPPRDSRDEWGLRKLYLQPCDQQ